MAADRDRINRSCTELSPGTRVEAWHHGRLIHHGWDSTTIPSMGMFWIIDARHGTRKLLDVEALEVIPLPEPPLAAEKPLGATPAA